MFYLHDYHVQTYATNTSGSVAVPLIQADWRKDFEEKFQKQFNDLNNKVQLVSKTVGVMHEHIATNLLFGARCAGIRCQLRRCPCGEKPTHLET